MVGGAKPRGSGYSDRWDDLIGSLNDRQRELYKEQIEPDAYKSLL